MVALPFCHFEVKASKRKSYEYPRVLETVGDHIRKRRLDLGLLQKEAAQRIGCSKASLVNWEKNHANPRIAQMGAVVKFLGYSPLDESDNLAQRLINHRTTFGMTQENFARALGVDPSTLARWERGERRPEGLYLKSVMSLLGSDKGHESPVPRMEPSLDSQNIGKRMMEHRAARRLTQADLALRIGVDNTTVARWESGERMPFGLRLDALLAELGLSFG